jgi:hypothetical protein
MNHILACPLDSNERLRNSANNGPGWRPRARSIWVAFEEVVVMELDFGKYKRPNNAGRGEKCIYALANITHAMAGHHPLEVPFIPGSEKVT